MILLTDQEEIGSYERYALKELLYKTTFDGDQMECIETQIEEAVTMHEYEEIEHYLYMNIIQDKDRIAMGLNYNQSDIKKALRLL
jgi:hypothetical protein